MKIFRNILAVILGIIVGSVVNMGIIMLGGNVIPYPEGVSAMDIESIKANIDKFETVHYIFPFLAHALGTLVGAWIAALIAGTRKMLFAMIIGVWFLLGGIWNSISLGMPFLATAIDWVFAYIPMAYIGGKLGTRGK